MNCIRVRSLLTAYFLRALDLAAHQRVEEHLEQCQECASLARIHETDIVRIGAALKTDLIPPAALLTGMERKLEQHRPRRYWLWPTAIAVATLVAAIGGITYLKFSPAARATDLEALNLTSVSVSLSLTARSADEAVKQFAYRGGPKVTALQAGPDGKFECAEWVRSAITRFQDWCTSFAGFACVAWRSARMRSVQGGWKRGSRKVARCFVDPTVASPLWYCYKAREPLCSLAQRMKIDLQNSQS